MHVTRKKISPVSLKKITLTLSDGSCGRNVVELQSMTFANLINTLDKRSKMFYIKIHKFRDILFLFCLNPN